MRRHTTPLILTALLALSLAPALRAQGYHQEDRRYDDRRQDDRYSYNAYPDYGHMDRVSAIAHEIDETATVIRREFERNNRRPDRAEARAIEQLRDLNRSADRFHEATESYRREPRRTARTFAALEQDFNDVARSLRRINRRPYVDRGMARIYNLMSELGGYYGRRSGYYGTWGHDRYDSHDRYDDHGRRDQDHDNGYRPPYPR